MSGLKCFSCRRTSISKVREVFKLPVIALQAVWCGWSTGDALAGGKMRMGWLVDITGGLRREIGRFYLECPPTYIFPFRRSRVHWKKHNIWH